MTLAHECTFPEVLITEDDEQGPLRQGMHVLAPCDCGETPFDEIDILRHHIGEYSRALTAAKPAMPLFHWAPRPRRNQILRYGLRPHMRGTTSTGWRAPVICFADSASWAWALSGEMKWTPDGAWDLWQTSLDRLTDPVVLPSEDRLSGIHEIRTEHRVFKRDIWWVGERLKP